MSLREENPATAAVVPLPGALDAAGDPPAQAVSNTNNGSRSIPPISRQRIQTCWKSAEFWAEVLAYQADALQKKADAWSISAGVLATVAGLSAWKLITDQTDAAWAVLLTSAVALAAAVCALVPRIKNYSENAALSRDLASRYGQSLGTLTDAAQWRASGSYDDVEVRRAVTEFEAIKKTKDSMRYLPVRCPETLLELRRRKSPIRRHGRRVAPAIGRSGRDDERPVGEGAAAV